MLQISFDNLSRKQKILEEDTLYSLYQANQKYEEFKKFIAESKDDNSIYLPDITLANENNISLLEITDIPKDSLNETLTSLLTKAIVVENQLEQDTNSIVAFEKQVKEEIQKEVIDKNTGLPELKERKETTMDKTMKNTIKGKKWILSLFDKESKTKTFPTESNHEDTLLVKIDDVEEESESTLGRLLIQDNLTDESLEVETSSKEQIKDVQEQTQLKKVESAAKSETFATQTETLGKSNENSIVERKSESIVIEDILVVSIRDSLKMLRKSLENINLTTTERELIFYKIDKFNSLAIEAETLVAKQNEQYNSTYTEKEIEIERKLKEEMANLLATIGGDKREQEEQINQKYIEIEKKEKNDYLNSNPEKEAQLFLKEEYNQKVELAKDDMDRQNQIRISSFFSDITNSVKERKMNELSNNHSNYKNIEMDESTSVRNKYEEIFNADMEKVNLDLLNEKKEFLKTELKNIEDTVLSNVGGWHELATKELNSKHLNLTLEKEKIELEIERSMIISNNHKQKEEYLLEIEKLKTEVKEKNKKEERYVANEETRLKQNNVSIDLQNRLIKELESKKSFIEEIDSKVEKTIYDTLELEKKKNEKMKYILYSTITLTIVSLGLAIYGLSQKNNLEGTDSTPGQIYNEVSANSIIEPEPEPEILSIEEYLENKDYPSALNNYPDNLDQIEQKIYSDKDLNYLKEFNNANASLYGAIDIALLEQNNEKIIEEFNKVEKKESISKDRLEQVLKSFRDTKKEEEAKKVEELLKG